MYVRSRGFGQTSSGIEAIADTIIQTEGSNPAYASNNNPGNLIYAGQSGATMGAGGFAAFPSYQAGLNALYAQIQSYANQGMSIQQMMNTYAPASASNDPTGVNNPSAYASYVANALGASPSDSVSDAIANFEGGTSSFFASLSDIFQSPYGSGPDPVMIAGAALVGALLIGLATQP